MHTNISAFNETTLQVVKLFTLKMERWNRDVFLHTLIQAATAYHTNLPSLDKDSKDIALDFDYKIMPNMIRSMHSFIAYRKRKCGEGRRRRKLSKFENKFIRDFVELWTGLQVFHNLPEKCAINNLEFDLHYNQKKRYNMILNRRKQ